MKTYKIKLVVEDYIDSTPEELVRKFKESLPDGILFVKVSAKGIE